jgi:phage host-nuclease inhibitor protein Gam
MQGRSWYEIERDRLNRKIERLGKKAVEYESQAQAVYKQIAYLYKEVYKLERVISEQLTKTPEEFAEYLYALKMK